MRIVLWKSMDKVVWKESLEVEIEVWNFEQNEEKTKFKVILSYVYLFLLSKKAWFSVPFYQSKRNRPMQGQGIWGETSSLLSV